MKPARIFPLLLLTLALLAPRMASAQVVIDSFWIVNDCGTDPGFDWGFVNNHSPFVNQFLLIITPASADAGFSFQIGTTAEDGTFDQNHWADSVTITGDTANYYPLNTGTGDATGIKDSAHFFLLGGPGGSQFPDSLFNKPVTIEWISIAGGTIVSSGMKTLIPTIYQGHCTFDSVSTSATNVGCYPTFNFHVFNHNGPQAALTQMQFQLQGFTAGSVLPSGVQAPTGWVVDSVSEFNAYFSTDCEGQFQLSTGANLSGFIVPILANTGVSDFTWTWTAFSCGDLVDAGNILSVPVTPPSCSETPNSDSLTIQNVGECSFQINAKNYHNDVDTVSPITSWTLTIASPDSATWSSAILPPQVLGQTWQYAISNSGKTLNFHELAKWMPVYGQPGGTIWTPRASIDNPNTSQPIIIQWSDSDATTFLSSGVDTTSCESGFPDTAWVVTGPGCDYTLIVENKHTNPTSGINDITMTIPASAGTFPLSCLSSSNKWTPSAFGQSARLSNISGANGLLKTGSFDTIHFCIDPAQTNSSWSLTWQTIDANGNNLFSNVITVPGCTPPLVCDSIRHVSDTGLCSETITVLNLRQGGAEVDSIIVTPTAPWTIETATVPPLWVSTISPDKSSVLFTGTLTAGDSRQFVVSYNNGSSLSSNVQVATTSNGAVCTNTVPITCALDAVSPSSVPQTLAVSVVPNPMNQEADIMLTTATFDRVQMTLLDVLGRTSKTVLNSTIAAGDHDYTVDVSQLPPGTYYLRIVASGATLTKKLVVEH